MTNSVVLAFLEGIEKLLDLNSIDEAKTLIEKMIESLKKSAPSKRRSARRD